MYDFFSRNYLRRLFEFILIIDIFSFATIYSYQSLLNRICIIVSCTFSILSFLLIRRRKSSKFHFDRIAFRNVLFSLLLTELFSFLIISNISIRLIEHFLALVVYTFIIHMVIRSKKINRKFSKYLKCAIYFVFAVCLLVDSIDLIGQILSLSAASSLLLKILANIIIAYLIYAIRYVYLPVKLLDHLTEDSSH